MRSAVRIVGGIGLLVLLAGGAPQSPPLPRPDHIVIVVEENKLYSLVVGNPDAPYINSLLSKAAVFTNYHALTHPSQPNYLAICSGSFQGVTNNTAPAPGSPFAAPNLGNLLIGAGRTFAGYSEDQPEVGYLGPVFNNYRRRHNPWSNFSNVPPESNLPYTHFPTPDRFDSLPTVSFVIPNLLNDMHSDSIARGDTWLKDNLDAYIRWAADHNSLFILTFDESNAADSNHILTLFIGPMVRPGFYAEPVNHLHLLRTLEDLYGLPYAGDSATVGPIRDVWVTAAPPPAAPPPAPDPPSTPIVDPDPEAAPLPKKEDNGCGWLGIEVFLLWSLHRLRRNLPSNG
ncbi:MAG: acid phosphatase [Planctomycetota bacterium]|nr:MAG: acid phosphatase [Planctomycetota bacterium]